MEYSPQDNSSDGVWPNRGRSGIVKAVVGLSSIDLICVFIPSCQAEASRKTGGNFSYFTPCGSYVNKSFEPRVCDAICIIQTSVSLREKVSPWLGRAFLLGLGCDRNDHRFHPHERSGSPFYLRRVRPPPSHKLTRGFWPRAFLSNSQRSQNALLPRPKGLASSKDSHEETNPIRIKSICTLRPSIYRGPGRSSIRVGRGAA